MRIKMSRERRHLSVIALFVTPVSFWALRQEPGVSLPDYGVALSCILGGLLLIAVGPKLIAFVEYVVSFLDIRYLFRLLKSLVQRTKKGRPA